MKYLTKIQLAESDILLILAVCICPYLSNENDLCIRKRLTFQAVQFFKWFHRCNHLKLNILNTSWVLISGFYGCSRLLKCKLIWLCFQTLTSVRWTRISATKTPCAPIRRAASCVHACPASPATAPSAMVSTAHARWCMVLVCNGQNQIISQPWCLMGRMLASWVGRHGFENQLSQTRDKQNIMLVTS